MAKKFGTEKGKAGKDVGFYTYKDGENVLRLVGDILPRYAYWIKDSEGHNHQIECLSFDREEERFTNREKDWVTHYFPEQKCSWSYLIQAVTEEGKLVLVPLKKKLYEQIKVAAEDLGDPTDLETGWNVVFKKVKTGSSNFNVEYTLQVLRCKHAALSEAQREAVSKLKPIEELCPRPTPNEVRELLESKILASKEDDDSDVPSDMTGSTSSDDDIPY